MKPLYFFTVTILCCAQTRAQLLNGSFETLTMSPNSSVAGYVDTVPLYWKIAQPFGGKMVTDAFAGNRAVRIWSWYYGQSNAQLTYGNDYFNRDQPISSRPVLLSGHYKYTLVNSKNSIQDSALAEVFLMKRNPSTHKRDTIGSGTMHFGAQPAYTRFELPLKYTSAVIPDSIAVIFRSSLYQFTNCDADGLGNCNYFYIDNLALASSTGMEEGDPELLKIYPNPVNSVLTVRRAAGKMTIVIYNATGELLREYPPASVTSLNLEMVPQGIYFLKISTQEGRSVVRKIIKE
jgi:hypothetical protein